MKKKFIFLSAILMALGLAVAACSHSNDSSSSTSSKLDEVINSGKVVCGSRDALRGFAMADSNGEIQGFDADFCRVVAAAVFGDSTKVEIKPLETSDRFTALQSGAIDVLIRNTTWTGSRDGKEGANFLYTTFYDGQGIMVPASSNIRSISDFAGENICLASGTTTELNLSSYFNQRNISFNPRTFDDSTAVLASYQSGQCGAITSDVSQLAGFKKTIEESGPTQRILGEIISKEPLGPAVKDGETRWAQAVEWAVMATVTAWEFGITSANIDTMLNSDNRDIQRFLGKDSDGSVYNTGLGLPADFAVNVIRQVGNYEEIYNRHIVPLGISLSGTPNDLWTNGGLHYTPPSR